MDSKNFNTWEMSGSIDKKGVISFVGENSMEDRNGLLHYLLTVSHFPSGEPNSMVIFALKLDKQKPLGEI